MIKRLKKFMIFSVTFFMLSSCFTNITYAAEKNKTTDKNVIESSESKNKTEDKDKTEDKSEKKNDENTLKDKDKNEEDKSTNDKDKLPESDEKEPEEVVMEDGWNIINGKKFYVVDNEILDKTGW
ncbi:MAG: hypothetical protein Q4F66_06305, partial [Clostridium sp.]|nr:hypothetical protein [Clostridium sp.]